MTSKAYLTSRLVSKGCKLVGCGFEVPSLQVSNDDLAKVIDTSDEWISVRTGIRNQRVLTGRPFEETEKKNLRNLQPEAIQSGHKMITTSREEDLTTKQEGNTVDGKNNSKASCSSKTTWSKLNNPRIVRVSRAFGGKDRHSKVCIGLRDIKLKRQLAIREELYGKSAKAAAKAEKIFLWIKLLQTWLLPIVSLPIQTTCFVASSIFRFITGIISLFSFIRLNNIKTVL
ncbi:hypothetical protein HYC85_007546 [Camellia sinensis]|uniref:Uncharacterized protein n=1 Tax=Camellia sinensis TaxID=4442 RepID=A0A7J7HP89_CAMSI|nr:hypothetical protein HYC85_007546 [Camellia sinensis]